VAVALTTAASLSLAACSIEEVNSPPLLRSTYVTSFEAVNAYQQGTPPPAAPSQGHPESSVLFAEGIVQ
jgi:hypothetical protein